MTALQLAISVMAFTLGLVLRGRIATTLIGIVGILQMYVGSLPIALPFVIAVVAGDLLRELLSGNVLAIRSVTRLHSLGVALGVGAVCATIVSILWSPSPTEALQYASQLAVMMMLIFYARRSSQRCFCCVRQALIVWIVVVTLNSLATILFRLRPVLEETYLRSQVADFLIGPSARALYQGSANNVLDPLKAGGMFHVNGNVASMVLGIALCALFAIKLSRASVRFTLGIVLAAGIFATGSKTGVVLLAVVPLLVAVMSAPRSSLRRRLLPVLSLLAPIVAIGVMRVVTSRFPNFVALADSSSDTRAVLWRHAGSLFFDHPILGLGFGGWEQEVWATLRSTYPPHNWVISGWADGGLLLALLLVSLAVWMIAVMWSVTGREDATWSEVRWGAAGTGAVVWCVLHGMFDNTSIYGDSRSTAALAFFVGGALAIVAVQRGSSRRRYGIDEVIA